MSLGREAPANVPSLRTDFWSEGTSSFVSVTIPAPHGCKGEVGGGGKQSFRVRLVYV